MYSCKALAPLTLSLVLLGCASLPENGVRAKLQTMPGLQKTLKTGDQSELVRDWPGARWWREFHNAELNRLIAAALSDNPSLKAAKARVAQAGAAADFQAAEMLPSINASAEFHHRRFSGTDFYGPNGGKTFTGAYIDPLIFRYHLDLWGKDRAALEAALGKERAAESELAMSRLLLSTAIARGYIRLCTVEEDLSLAHEASVQAGEKQHLAQLRRQRGLTAEDPVHAEEQSLQAAKQRETGLRKQTQVLRNQLATLAGQGPDWGLAIRAAAIDAAAYLLLPSQLPLGLLAHRPDIAAALWQVRSAAQGVKVAETHFYPDVNLVGFAGLRSLNLKDLFLSNGASVAYGVGPTVTLPIFEGGRLEAELKNRQAEYDAAAETYNAALLTAVQQVANSVAEWRQTVTDNEDQAKALAAAQAEAALADKRYQAGLSARDGVIDADLRLIEQQLTASAFHGGQLLAAIGLIEALGGGYENPITNGLYQVNHHGHAPD